MVSGKTLSCFARDHDMLREVRPQLPGRDRVHKWEADVFEALVGAIRFTKGLGMDMAMRFVEAVASPYLDRQRNLIAGGDQASLKRLAPKRPHDSAPRSFELDILRHLASDPHNSTGFITPISAKRYVDNVARALSIGVRWSAEVSDHQNGRTMTLFIGQICVATGQGPSSCQAQRDACLNAVVQRRVPWLKDWSGLYV